MSLKRIYLILSVVGFVVPYIFFIGFIMENGLDVSLFFKELFANNISSFFGVDVIISALALIIYILVDSRKNHIKRYYLAILGTLLIGVSFALPFYLYLKESQKN